MVVWCPDWPVTAAVRAGLAPEGAPVGVFRANRVVAASASARADGVRRAMRRREAQARCPELEVLDDDDGRDARCFEDVAAALDRFTPRIEVVRAGLAQFPTRGPSRYFGGDAALSTAVRLALAEVGVEARLGVADGAFAAAIAARRGELTCVDAGTSATFLAAFPISALVAVEGGRAVTRAAATARRARARTSATTSDTDALALVDLVDLLQRLGITTLGAFAALPHVDVVSRFGPVGERAWRLASGLDVRPPDTRVPPPDLVVETELDPPVERVDTAAFVAKAMAETFHERLAHHGLACTRVRIEARTHDGVELVRLWRHERAGAAGGLTSHNLADRVRWQLDGWLTQRRTTEARTAAADGDMRADDHPGAGGIVALRLVPDEVVADTGRQLGLWCGVSETDERAARGFARVQGLLGPDAVCTPVLTGGRRPGDLVALVPWGDQRAETSAAKQPWPGRLPAPLPTVVHEMAQPAEVLDEHGVAVGVTGRGEITAAPATVITGGMRTEVSDWAGPWPLEERWWDLQSARRQARVQLLTADGRALLAVLESGSWWIEAEYG